MNKERDFELLLTLINEHSFNQLEVETLVTRIINKLYKPNHQKATFTITPNNDGVTANLKCWHCNCISKIGMHYEPKYCNECGIELGPRSYAINEKEER